MCQASIKLNTKQISTSRRLGATNTASTVNEEIILVNFEGGVNPQSCNLTADTVSTRICLPKQSQADAVGQKLSEQQKVEPVAL